MTCSSYLSTKYLVSSEQNRNKRQGKNDCFQLFSRGTVHPREGFYLIIFFHTDNERAVRRTNAVHHHKAEK